MGIQRKDYVLNLIEQLSRILREMAALISEGRPGLALVQLQEMRETLAGPLGSHADRLDDASLAALLGTDKSRLWAELSRMEAQAHTALGNPEAAERARRRADGLARLV